jgi:5-methyltetrahydrofolate--homocysteine methyltransferase
LTSARTFDIILIAATISETRQARDVFSNRPVVVVAISHFGELGRAIAFSSGMTEVAIIALWSEKSTVPLGTVCALLPQTALCKPKSQVEAVAALVPPQAQEVRNMASDLVTAMVELREEEVLELVEERLRAGDDPLDILSDTRKALTIIGNRFEEKEYFIPELVFAGEIASEVSEILQPELTTEGEAEYLGTIVIGTVAGDIHDIGKNIVSFMLDTSGFKVNDLGIDVSPETFVDSIRETEPDVVGLSGFLTFSYDMMKETIEAIAEAGLRDQVKIMIGGGQIDDQVVRYANADAHGPDAMAAVSLAKQWVDAE